MSANTIFFQTMVFLCILIPCAYFMGNYMTRVFKGEKTFLSFLIRPIEKWLYKITGIKEENEMTCKTYVISVLMFNLLGFLFLFILLIAQQYLPLNPESFPGLRLDSAFNAAVSFVTNTNWQSYGGESTLSYLSQMLGMAVQNFLSAGVGIAVLIAFLRGFSRKSAKTIGNFWVDFTKSVLYILLPLCVVLSLVLVSQGSIQNFDKYTHIKTLEGREQIIAQGPVASQAAIKMIGTNGGGFFNANASHPYENPTPLTDYLQIFAMLIIAAGLPFTLGNLLDNKKLGITIFSAMFILYILGLIGIIYSEFHGSPIMSQMGVLNGLSMEGKEVRFGILNSAVFSQTTTVISCGAVNNMHDSLMPLSGLILMFNMMIGEVIFGGVGAGLIGMILYAVLAMFLAGLMIGRTPEIFGKKLEPYEMIMTMFALLAPLITQLIFGAIATKIGLSSLNNGGAHGLSEIIYAFASGAGNNGSAFAGLNANTPFYNLSIAICMIVARFAVIIPPLLIAGSLASKKSVPEETRFPNATPLFVVILIFTILIVGALTFFPILVLGPILEWTFLKASWVF